MTRQQPVTRVVDQPKQLLARSTFACNPFFFLFFLSLSLEISSNEEEKGRASKGGRCISKQTHLQWLEGPPSHPVHCFMESDTLFSQRPVTKVYKRKKGRRQRFPQKLAPSPLRNGITINQDSSEEEEEGEKEAEAGQPPVTPHGSPKQNSSPQKFSRSTPPSTPSRKQKVSSRKSSPSKSSTSSPSKINIDREIGNIFSPNKKVGVFLDDEEDINEPAWDLPSPSPKKPSFADRMAPRKAKKEDKGNVEQADQEEEGGEQMVSDFEFISQRADTSQGSTQQGEQPLPMIESAKCKPQSRIYKRVPSLPEVDLQSASLIIDGLGEPRPCLKEMSKRWAELDDLDDTDEEVSSVVPFSSLVSVLK